MHEKAEDTEKDFNFITEWESCWERQNLPREIPRLGLNSEPVSDILLEAKKIHDKYGMVIVTILDSQDMCSPHSHLNTTEKDNLLDQTLYIVPSPGLLPCVQHLPHKAVASPQSAYPKVPHQNMTAKHPKDQQYLLQIILTLTQHQLKVLTLPFSCHKTRQNCPNAVPEVSSAIPRPKLSNVQIQESKESKLLAGRCEGQISPDIEFMFWDGQFEEIFRFVIELLNLVKGRGLTQFKHAWIELKQHGNTPQWDWL